MYEAVNLDPGSIRAEEMRPSYEYKEWAKVLQYDNH